MAGKMGSGKKRMSNLNRKSRFTSYKVGLVREKNKARRILKDILRSRDAEATMVKLKPQMDGLIWRYVEKYYNQRKAK